MDIRTAKYIKTVLGAVPSVDDENTLIDVTLDDDTGGIEHKLIIPIVNDNTDYIEIMRQVDVGDITIAESD